MATLVALFGYNILVIDCDPQAHLSHAFGFDIYADYLTLFDIIDLGIPIEKTITQVCEGLDFIPSNLSMTRLETTLGMKHGREFILQKKLNSIKDNYDYIFLDTNPSIGILNQNALTASDLVNIVCETQPFSLKGLEILLRELENFDTAMNLKTNFKIIPNKYDQKTASSQEVLGILRANYKEFVLNSVIRRCEEFNASAKNKIPIHAFAKKTSNAFIDVCELARELINISTISKEEVKNAA